MLNALLRTASVVALLCGSTACTFGSSPNVGSSGSNSRKKDAGTDDSRRVTSGSGNVRSRDAEVDAESDDERAAAGKGGAGGAKSSTTKNTGGKGGAKAEMPAEEPPVEPEEPEEEKPAPKDAGREEPPAQEPATMDAGNPSPTDAGQELPPIDAAIDAGSRPTVDNPFGVLGDLAQRTAGGKTAATINQFLETLAKGDAPATSIRDFLLTIDDELDCVMNPFATECLAACQAVATTCAVCVFDTDCRTTMIEICGYSALVGCVPRR